MRRVQAEEELASGKRKGAMVCTFRGPNAEVFTEWRISGAGMIQKYEVRQGYINVGNTAAANSRLDVYGAVTCNNGNVSGTYGD